MPFTCSICEELSTHICVSCTKDACANHLCLKCHRCSDCCECEDPVAESAPLETVAQANVRSAPVEAEPAPPASEEAPQPASEPEPPEPQPEPESALVGGTEPFARPQPPFEPAGIPPEDVPGEAPDKDFA
jgi:hypothetical protein